MCQTRQRAVVRGVATAGRGSSFVGVPTVLVAMSPVDPPGADARSTPARRILVTAATSVWRRLGSRVPKCVQTARNRPRTVTYQGTEVPPGAVGGVNRSSSKPTRAVAMRADAAVRRVLNRVPDSIFSCVREERRATRRHASG
jgi:hypothetical protein